MMHKTLYKKSKYKYVVGLCSQDDIWNWHMNIPNVTKKGFKTEKEAAIAVDMYFISKGKQPLNILKKL